MGYFNIFYKITRIIDMLTRKRNRKFIFILLMVIGIIFLLHNKGYCAQEDSTYTTDTTYFVLERYQSLIDNFVLSFDKYYGKDTTTTNAFNSLFTNIQSGRFVYFYQATLDGNIRVFTYDRSTAKVEIDTSLVYNNGTRIPSTAYNMTWYAYNTYYYINFFAGDDAYKILTTNSANDINFTVPYILLYRVPVEIIEIMERAGYTYENNQDIIDIKELLEEQNDKLDAINNSLTNTIYNESVVDFDTDSVDNVDDTEITGLFTGVIGSFSNALNSYGGTITKIIPLPHGRSNRNTKQYSFFTFRKSNRFG